MRLSPAHAVTLLLIVATVTVPVSGAQVSNETGPPQAQLQAPSPLLVPVANFSNHLAIPDDEVRTAAYADGDIDVGTAIAADTNRLDGQFETLSFERSFYRAERDAERTGLIRNLTNDLDERRQTLERRQQEAIRAYADGSISSEQFLRRMALIANEASEHRQTIGEARGTVSTARYSLPPSLDTRLENLNGAFEVLGGPLGERAMRATTGAEPLETMYVEASETGYTFAVTSDDTYVRETFLGDERDPNATDQFRESDEDRVNAANTRSNVLYPWVDQRTTGFSQALATTGIYRFQADFTNGELTAYLDGATTNVFRETQRQRVAAIPVTDTIEVRNDGVAVRVERTYDTGPMFLNVTDNGTDRPVNGTVTVNGHTVGQTGSDGTMWLVEPRPGVPLSVTTDDGREVKLRIPA